jgi:hypothetical protein
MSELQTEAPEFSKGVLTGHKLLKVVAIYISAAKDVPLDDEEGAGDITCQLLKDRLTEIARLDPEDAPSAAMFVVDFAVSSAAAAASEPPPKAIALIARFYTELEERLDDMIAKAKRHAAKEAT